MLHPKPPCFPPPQRLILQELDRLMEEQSNARKASNTNVFSTDRSVPKYKSSSSFGSYGPYSKSFGLRASTGKSVGTPPGESSASFPSSSVVTLRSKARPEQREQQSSTDFLKTMKEECKEVVNAEFPDSVDDAPAPTLVNG